MVNGTHIHIHTEYNTITWEEMDGEPITRFLTISGRFKYNPIWFVYFYGASRWSSEAKLESTKIGDDIYVLGYHPDNKLGDLMRFGPDSMELIEFSFPIKDFNNLHNLKIFSK